MSPRILIVRPSAIGDIVMATTLWHGLRARWPQARIGWLVDSRFASLIEGLPGLDRVHRFDRREWGRLGRSLRWAALWREAMQLRAELRTEGYDLALDAQGLARSSLLSWLSGAPRRVVLRPRECARLLATETVPARERRWPGDEYRDLLRAVGAISELPQARMRLPLLDSDQSAADTLLRDARGAALAVEGRPLVALIPCTTRPQKHWFDDRWAELGAAYASKGCDVVVLGGPSDQPRCDEIVSKARARGPDSQRVWSIAGQTTLRVAGGVLARSQVTIGVDTGLMHLSMANGTPTVALFGSAYPYVEALSGSVVLREPMACAPCDRRPTCGGRFDCMRALTVDRVAAAVQSISGL